jgi:hypothetical protein
VTVAELIETLRKMPGDLTVMADGLNGRYEVDVIAQSTYYGTLPSHVVIK